MTIRKDSWHAAALLGTALLLIPTACLFAESTGGGLLGGGKVRHGHTLKLLGAKAKIRLGIIGVNVVILD
jgi:hypothetical protein